MNNNEVTIEQVQKLLDWLVSGEVPDGWFFLSRQRAPMSYAEAYQIIHALQVNLHLIPDGYELCAWCGNIYDSAMEGEFSVDAGSYEYEAEWLRDAGFLQRDVERIFGMHFCEWSSCGYPMILRKQEEAGDGEK